MPVDGFAQTGITGRTEAKSDVSVGCVVVPNYCHF